MASEAPWPELDDGACAESPTRTIRPRRHAGTLGMLSIAPTTTSWAGSVRVISRAAGGAVLGEGRRQPGAPFPCRGPAGLGRAERLVSRQAGEPGGRAIVEDLVAEESVLAEDHRYPAVRGGLA
jgi:hypothetical protein